MKSSGGFRPPLFQKVLNPPLKMTSILVPIAENIYFHISHVLLAVVSFNHLEKEVYVKIIVNYITHFAKV